MDKTWQSSECAALLHSTAQHTLVHEGSEFGRELKCFVPEASVPEPEGGGVGEAFVTQAFGTELNLGLDWAGWGLVFSSLLFSSYLLTAGLPDLLHLLILALNLLRVLLAQPLHLHLQTQLSLKHNTHTHIL